MASELPQILSDEEFAALLKRREPQVGTDFGAWDSSYAFRAAPKSDGLPESTLEQRFPHIAKRLTAIWRSEECTEYLNHLVVSERETRVGFPMEVVEDLMLLHSINEMVRYRGDNNPFGHAVPLPFAGGAPVKKP